MSAAFLIARLIFGLGLAGHGAQKLFGWFGGYGLKGTGGFMESLGFRPGVAAAAGAGLGEFCGGLLLALGFFGGLGPALVILVLLVAIFTVHIRNGFFVDNKGWELPSLYIAGALTLDFAGFGAYSLDRVLNLQVLSTENLRWILVGAAIVIAALVLLSRRVPHQQSQQA